MRLSLIFPFILIRLVWGLKQIPWKNESYMSIFNHFWTKIWLKVIDEQPNFLVAGQYFFKQIFVRKSHTMGLLLSFLHGVCFKPHANLASINGNIEESLTWINGFSMVSAIVVVLNSHDSPPCSWISKMPRQTVQTQLRLLLKKQSDQGLPCLLFWWAFREIQPW